MTLVLSVAGERTVWLLADRRLSRNGKPLQDDACKVLLLEAEDGVAVLGYAGLGKTVRGTEPSQWMNGVFRGLSGTVDGYLELLRQALEREFPRHVGHLSNLYHHVIVAAYVKREPRVYTIDMLRDASTGKIEFRVTRHIQRHNKPPIFRLTGPGGIALLKDRLWMRPLARLVRAHDRGSIDHMPVANYLAGLNAQVSRAIGDASVSHQCVVACRHRDGGGGHWTYEDGAFGGHISPPSIVQGRDMVAFCEPLMEQFQGLFARMQAGEVDVRPSDQEMEELNKKIQLLPMTPDEKLR